MTESMVEGMARDVARFAREVRGVNIPVMPVRLTEARKQCAIDHLYEEFEEYREADTLVTEADALVDLVYVALGRLVEMGIAPGPVFDAVHETNMRKVPGHNEKRPNDEHDAVKPDGWTPPDLSRILAIGLADLGALSPVLLEITRMREAKGRDYNSSVEIPDYFPLGHSSYFQMVHLKTKRLQSLIEVESRGGMPNFEGIRDTLLDLLNYAVFYVEALDRGDLVMFHADETPNCKGTDL